MTQFAPHPQDQGLVKLTGAIRSLSTQREHASFVFTESGQNAMGVVAVAASLAGLGGQAMTTASAASSLEEAADYLQFFLNDEPVKGWVWRSPFRDGDVVEIAALKTDTHWEVYGIARPRDKTIALYPHCSRGRARHYWNAFKWWWLGWGGGIALVGVPLFYSISGSELFSEKEPWLAMLGLFLFFGVATFSMSRQWLPFVKVAERVFRALELPNPSGVDLVKRTKAQRTEKDPAELGAFYFRY